jgi:hypothetical protein
LNIYIFASGGQGALFEKTAPWTRRKNFSFDRRWRMTVSF